MSYQRDFLARKLRDPQAKFVHDLAQIQANQAADNVSFITSNLKGYSIKVATKTTSKDKYYLNIRELNDDNFVTGRYPDYDNCRLFIRTENAGNLHDYSLMDNDAYVFGTMQVPEVFIKEDPNDPAKHEFVAYFNGTHYVIVKDHSRINIKNIVENEPTKAGFTFVRRLTPMRKGNSAQDSVIIAQKTDTSQNQYGYSLNLDHEGNFYFYVKYNYRQYFVKLNSNLTMYTATKGNFAFENFNQANFFTDIISLQDLTKISLDIACSFNFTTKEAVIELRNLDLETNTWTMIGRVSSIAETIPNTQINLPLQEGKWSAIESTPLNQVYDISSNQFVGTINNPTTTGTWQDDNTLENIHGNASTGTHITIPNHANLDNLTEFSIAFWVKFDPYIIDGNFYTLVSKGWNGVGGFIVYKDATTNSIVFVINNGAQRAVVYSNPPIVAGQWHFICAKWKSGEQLKLSIDGNTVTSASSWTGTLTNANVIKIHDTRSYNQTVINFEFFNRQITTLEQTTLYNYGAHLAQFPQNKEPQISPAEELPPITVPYSLLYDIPRITVPTLSDYLFLNNPSADNPFVPKYNTADGTASTIPLETLYNVPSGTGGTTSEPFTTIYTLAGASSTGSIDDESNEWAYAQYILTTNSTLEDRKITEIQVWLNSANSPNGGTAYLGIIKANGTWIQFGTGISVSSIPDSWTSYTKQLLTNTYVTQVGDGVGVIWIDSESGDLNVRRGGDGNHASGEGDSSGNAVDSAQNHYDSDSGWGSPHDRFSMAGTIKIGGGTTGTSPYQTLTNDSGKINVVGELFGSTSNMKDKAPTEAEFKVYKKASSTGTLVLAIFTSLGVVKTGGTLKSWNIASDPSIGTTDPTTNNLIYQNYDNTMTIASGERLCLYVTGMNLGGEVYVMTNTGNTAGANNYNSSTSYLTKRTGSGTWSNTTTVDLTGVIKTGGSSFVPYKRFSATLTRIYERATSTSSSFKLNEPITQVKVRGRKAGTIPAPAQIGCYIRRQSDNAVQETIEVKDANAVGGVLQDIFFENRAADYLIQVGDYISIELSGCNASNYIELNINNNVTDGTHSVLGVYENNVAGDLANYDLAGTFFTGGQVDALSRIRVGQFINTQNSMFITADDNSITYMELAMIKVGAPTGTFYVNIRNEDDAAVKTLYSGPVSGLSDVVNSPTIVFVNDSTNKYILKPKDKILVEYDGGDTNNKIGVMVRAMTPNYDGTESYVARSNGIEYDYDTTKDLVATIKVGGYTYTPDPGSLPPSMPQLSTDLYLGVRGDKVGLYEKCLSDLFLFTTEILTTTQLDNFIKLRVDIEDAEPHELLVTHHTFIHAQ